MSLLRSKSEQLADLLRERIERGELAGHLPGTRPWSRELGVARKTLHAALTILSKEGLVIVSGRGAQVNRPGSPQRSQKELLPRVVRMLFYGRDYPDFPLDRDWIFLLSETLQVHGIQVHVEKCTDLRLQEIAREKGSGRELFFLVSVAPRHQRLFAQSKKPCLLVGSPAENVDLPFITISQDDAVAHAARMLLREGISRVELVIARLAAAGVQETIRAFEKATDAWSRKPVQVRIVGMPSAGAEALPSARRLANRVAQAGRMGLIVMEPAPVSLVLTALLERGVAVPKQVRVVSVLASDAVQLCPPLPRYPWPHRRLAKQYADAAIHYFASGLVPPVRKRLTLALTPATA